MPAKKLAGIFTYIINIGHILGMFSDIINWLVHRRKTQWKSYYYSHWWRLGLWPQRVFQFQEIPIRLRQRIPQRLLHRLMFGRRSLVVIMRWRTMPSPIVRCICGMLPTPSDCIISKITPTQLGTLKIVSWCKMGPKSTFTMKFITMGMPQMASFGGVI